MRSLTLVFLFFIFIPHVKSADNSAQNSPPQVIIIIDDMGYRQADTNAFSLPIEVAVSILPKTPLAKQFALRAHEQGRDVMLHLPMSSLSDKKLGPGGLTSNMRPHQIDKILDENLASVPYAIGVNNHMGSALTADKHAMQRLMLAIKQRSLFFIDSRTTSDSVAYDMAATMGVLSDQRHVFLDHIQTHEFYEQQLTQLVNIAKQHGRAIGIAHPYPSSLAYLSKALPDIEQRGVALSSISTFFANKVSNNRSSVNIPTSKLVED